MPEGDGGLAVAGGVSPPDEGDVRVNFDDSIITDTAAEKQQDMAEIAAGLMLPDEYRAKWYGGSPCGARDAHIARGDDVSTSR